MYQALRDKGYIIEKGKGLCDCDNLHKDGSRLDLYMHPMRFTGPATPEEADEITGILLSCGCVKKALLTRANVLYDIPDMEYRDMFLDNAEKLSAQMLSPFNFNDFLKKVSVDRIHEPACGVIGSDQINYNILYLIEQQIKTLREEGMADEDIPTEIGRWAEAIKAEVHRLDRLFSEAVSTLDIPER